MIKKAAFTMAEILITLGIISVIAVLTLPTLSYNVTTTQFASVLRTSQATISDKLDAAMALEDVSNIRDLKPFVTAGEDLSALYKGLSKYLALSRVNEDHVIRKLNDGSTAATWAASDIRQINTNAFIYITNFNQDKTTTGGALIKQNGGNILRRVAEVYIDVNGYVKPNQLGYDVYKYYLAQDGRLYPVGGRDVALFESAGASGDADSGYGWEGGSDEYKCDKNSSGYGCAGRVEDEDWKIKYLGKK